ncbi:MAG TPA: FG-GAP-like repeat-containing protein [Bryobacteraceae bacterium]|nr:FG-GAP-like repeat-containing protein [Bryobacteraceae bacterium]
MAQTSGTVANVPAASVTAGGHAFRIADRTLTFDGGSASFDYFLGSNTHGRSYLYSHDRYLYELPLTWYQKLKAWDMSPGYENERDVKMDRAIDPTCLSCHASRLQPIYGTRNRYAERPFLDDGVSCERCHGPGSEHVKNPTAAKMIDPAGLSGEALDSVCAQCHLTGEARVEKPGRKFAEYRAGDKLSDFVTYFIQEPAPAARKVTSHFESLANSACRRASGTLWCGTCHEPHTNANRTQAACIGCHPSGHHQDQSCASCHMPKVQPIDITHGVTTDHTISGIPHADGAARLTALIGSADDREFGLAYAERNDPRGRDLLSRAAPRDAPVLVRLAGYEQDRQHAAALYEAALKSDPNNITALVNLGTLDAQVGRSAEAEGLWRRALEADALNQAALTNLEKLYGQSPFEIRGSEKTGITWQHDNALSPRRYQPESVGPGVAIFDYDNDGRMDLFFPNSGPSDFYSPATPPRNALYHNDGGGHFTDVSDRAGVSIAKTFGMGVAAADYDGDGFTDLLITGYDHNVLYRNRGDGTFEDVTQRAGVDAKGFFTSAVWFDYNNDGRPDLFIAGFVRYSKALEKECKTAGVYHYCYPASYDPSPSKLYRNNGDGTFTDVSVSSGIAAHPGKSFGAVAVDLDGDGFLDLFVSNDSVPNFLFHNKGNGTFEEIALEAGVAYSENGMARSGMGVDAADYDRDGRPDLFVANLNRERFSLYRNLGGMQFEDAAGPAKVGAATYLYSGWGSRFFDFNNDGFPDLVLANGHPDDLIEQSHTGLKWKERLLLLENQKGIYRETMIPGGELAGRGLAVGDLDNDGWPDVVVAVNGGAPVILHNKGGSNHWIGIEGVRAGCTIEWSGGRRFVTAGGSYLSSQDPRVIIGLGEGSGPESVDVKCPGGERLVSTPQLDRYYRISMTDK